MSGERLFEKIDISENPAISNGKSTELSATFLEEKILGWREPSVAAHERHLAHFVEISQKSQVLDNMQSGNGSGRHGVVQGTYPGGP